MTAIGTGAVSLAALREIRQARYRAAQLIFCSARATLGSPNLRASLAQSCALDSWVVPADGARPEPPSTSSEEVRHSRRVASPRAALQAFPPDYPGE